MALEGTLLLEEIVQAKEVRVFHPIHFIHRTGKISKDCINLFSRKKKAHFPVANMTVLTC